MAWRSVDIVFPERNHVAVWEREVQPPGSGEVLCEAQKSLISIGTETLCLQGVFDPDTYWSEFLKYPLYPGYSMVARVIAVGPGVEGVREGDRVATRTSHRQRFAVTSDRVFPIPDEISDEDATWITLGCTTQLGIRRGEFQLGESVGVIGLGILGQLVAQYLYACGARRIVVIDTAQRRLDLALSHGATHAVAADAETAREEVFRITDGKMLDAVFDVTGHPAVLAPATRLVRRLGRVILLGDTTTPSRQHLGPRVVADSIGILGIHGGMYPQEPSEFHPWGLAEMSSLFCDYLHQGRMRVADLVTHRYSPADAPDVYSGLLFDRTEALGILFDWSLV